VNIVFFLLVFVAFLVAAARQILWDPGGMEEVAPMALLTDEMIGAAKASVELAIGLVGVMALFLGLMKVAEQGGLLTIIAKTVRPLMTRLFPEVPANHPAMGAMILNISANVLGLGNAATPFGIRAMQALDTLNPHKGTATNAMVLFLAINTSSVTLLPTGVIALRASLGSLEPAAIVPTTLVATIASTCIAILAAKTLQRFFPATPAEPAEQDDPGDTSAADTPAADTPEAPPPAPEMPAEADETYPLHVSLLVLLGIAALVPLTVIYGREISPWIVPLIMVGLLGFGMAKGVRIYEAFVEGAKDGFQVALRIIPYLVAILVAVAMFRASGALEALVSALAVVTDPLGLPAEAVPMALLRPLSGSGAYGVMTSIMQDPATGPDSYVGMLVSTLQGSTETTFYVLAVYFGAVQVRRIRHALAAGITADVAGVVAAVAIVGLLFGGL
jgi:spore maturation protein SpmA